MEYGFILPIVHYEGSGKWTAATHLKDRINMDCVNGILDNAEAYIPDFSYKLIQTKDYSNEQLLEKNNEMNATTQEAEECVANLREGKMGYWHENIEKMDIQAERRNTVIALQKPVRPATGGEPAGSPLFVKSE